MRRIWHILLDSLSRLEVLGRDNHEVKAVCRADLNNGFGSITHSSVLRVPGSQIQYVQGVEGGSPPLRTTWVTSMPAWDKAQP